MTCYIQQSSHHFPSQLLIAHNAREKRYFDIYRADVATGDCVLLLQLNDGLVHHFTNHHFAVRPTEEGNVEYFPGQHEH